MFRLFLGLALIAAAATFFGVVQRSFVAADSADAPPGSVTTYQINPLHDGNAEGSLELPLAEIWSVDLDAKVSYPLIVNGRVFVATANPDGSHGARLYVFNQLTGALLWGLVALEGLFGINGIAADGERVYSISFDGTLRAFEQSTGVQNMDQRPATSVRIHVATYRVEWHRIRGRCWKRWHRLRRERIERRGASDC